MASPKAHLQITVTDFLVNQNSNFMCVKIRLYFFFFPILPLTLVKFYLLHTPITTFILFAEWGVDILSPLPRAPGWHKLCIVAIDYFTKWNKIESLVIISEDSSGRKKVVYRFDLVLT